MQELTNHAGEIRRHHDAAQSAAKIAIEHALAAGQLLSEAKVHIEHGQFENWIVNECGISVRNAQRYMRLHRHRESLPAGAGIRGALDHVKSDTGTHLEKALRLETEATNLRVELVQLDARLKSANSVDELAQVANRATVLAQKATEILVRAGRGLGEILNSPDLIHSGINAGASKPIPAWLPPTGEAALTVAHDDRQWFVWKDDDEKYAHALFLDLHSLAGDGCGSGIATKRPIQTSYLRDQLQAMELAKPDSAMWWRFPLRKAKELRELLIQK